MTRNLFINLMGWFSVSLGIGSLPILKKIDMERHEGISTEPGYSDFEKFIHNLLKANGFAKFKLFPYMLLVPVAPGKIGTISVGLNSGLFLTYDWKFPAPSALVFGIKNPFMLKFAYNNVATGFGVAAPELSAQSSPSGYVPCDSINWDNSASLSGGAFLLTGVQVLFT